MTTSVFAIPGIIPLLTRRWVALYCTGLSRAARQRRLLEIESDLWEHYSDRYSEGTSPASVNNEMLGRLLRGIPSDIAWRFQAEGFHMNIQFPIERVIGVLLLFLLVPFFAGSAISGYDTRIEEWPSEMLRYSDMSSTGRELTGYAHTAVGVLALVGVSQLLVRGLRRSPGLIGTSAALLATGGVIMVINGGVYFGMSAVADDFVRTGDPALVTTARGYARVIEFFAMVNLGTIASGVGVLSIAVARMGLLPRWTMALPAAGALSVVSYFILWNVDDTFAWGLLMLGWLMISLWLIIGGTWLLFGGRPEREQPLAPGPSPA